MPSDDARVVDLVLEHIAEIGSGKCSITDASIAAEADPSVQQILAGLLMLHEDLQYAQQRQLTLLEDLREAVRARDEFLSVASHELRTPITTLTLQIDGLSRMVHDQSPPVPVPEKMSRRLDVTRRQVDRLAALVATLIDVSRITSGKVQVARQLADLVEVIRSVAERFGEEVLRTGSTLRFERHGPIWGNFDVSRIDQVLSNLLTNAIRYGRGRPIAIGAVSVGQTARFWVQDQGIGIAPEHQARVFQRYERAAPAANYAGLGLGLWISRQLVEAMGGTITLRSEPDVGSTFTVEIPRSG
ncbi:MAG TPA: HAMP domain-containing sensor histidine kinase [Polyangia bacterium]|nr:HAMP domain-containing sensor histidine kinase [Polyangia bacterium]